MELVGASEEELAARVGRALGGVSRVWLAPQLRSVRQHLASGTAIADDPADGEVAVVAASALAEDGTVSLVDATGPARTLDSLAGRAGALIAVLTTHPLKVVTLCESPTTARVERAYHNLGVLDVTAGGLVIVELARGVSAVQLQQHAEPTLMVSPNVKEMVVAACPSSL